MSSETTRSASATSAGSPDSVSALPRTWISAVRRVSSARRFSSAEPSRPTTRSGGTLMLLRTGESESAFVSRGVTWGFLPAFWVSWLVDCSRILSLPPGTDASQRLPGPTLSARRRNAPEPPIEQRGDCRRHERPHDQRVEPVVLLRLYGARHTRPDVGGPG